MFDSTDLVIWLLGGALAAMFGIAFRALPAESQRRWKPRAVAIAIVVGVLALVVWVKLLVDYRP